jgi:hypothetical protein
LEPELLVFRTGSNEKMPENLSFELYCFFGNNQEAKEREGRGGADI